MRAAIIGSFRQHYEAVLDVWRALKAEDVEITSPLGDPIIEPNVEFVRFTSDPPDWDSPAVQTVALHRIMRADAVYVVAPGAYVGRTTCYEIGRVIQASRPLYFSERPDDLPIEIPDDHVVSPAEFVQRLVNGQIEHLYEGGDSPTTARERELLAGHFTDL